MLKCLRVKMLLFRILYSTLCTFVLTRTCKLLYVRVRTSTRTRTRTKDLLYHVFNFFDSNKAFSNPPHSPPDRSYHNLGNDTIVNLLKRH